MYDEEEDTGERRTYATGEYAAMIACFAKGVNCSLDQQASLLANEYLAATQANYACIEAFADFGIDESDRELLREMIDEDGLGITLSQAEQAVIELCNSRVDDMEDYREEQNLAYWIERLDDGSLRLFEQEHFADGGAGPYIDMTSSYLPEDLELKASGGEMEGLPIAEILPVAGTVVATGWVFGWEED